MPETLAPVEALEAARRAVAAIRDSARGKFAPDDFDDATFSVSMDLLHLDADAMSDRLAAWIAREVASRLPTASATVSWQHARAASLDDEDADEEALWKGVEPTFRLDLHHAPLTRADVEAWAALVPAFLRVVDGAGRPAGWRPDPTEGALE